MKSDVTTLDDGKIKLSVEVDEETFDKALDDAFRRIGAEVRVPGFRPGKVPRRVLEARLGSSYARGEALQAAIPEYYASAVREHRVDVIAPPEIDLTAGQDDGPVVFDAVVEIRPEIDLDGYEGLRVEVPVTKATDDEIQEQVDAVRGQFADLEEVSRPAVDGDHVTIDIRGQVDGEPVPGLTAEDYLYEVGLGAVVPELDDELRGAKAGDILSFEAEHPSDPDELLDFRILVKKVQQKVLPDLTDEWVAENTEFDTVAAMRADISERITKVRRFQAIMAFRENATEALAGLVGDDVVPESMVEGEASERLHQFAHQLEDRGATLDDWQSVEGNSIEQLQADARSAGLSSAKVDLALRAIARQQGVEPSASDVDEELDRLAEQLEQPAERVREAIESGDGLSALRSDLLKRKAFDWFLDQVSVFGPDGEIIDRSELELPDEDDDEERAAAETETAAAETDTTDTTTTDTDAAAETDTADETETDTTDG